MNTSLKTWLGNAVTVAIRGFIRGLPTGGLAGSALAGAMAAYRTAAVTPQHAALLGGLHVAATTLAVAVSFASHEVVGWANADANQFPNIFVPSATSKALSPVVTSSTANQPATA